MSSSTGTGEAVTVVAKLASVTVMG
jgi:hypothetical protein